MSNAENAPPGCTFAVSAGTAIKVGVVTTFATSHQVLAANNAETPAYGNLFST
jgi:hypothetical protein